MDASQQDESFGDYGRLVYVPDTLDGYVLGRIIEITMDSLNVQLANGKMIEVPYEDALPADEDPTKEAEDNCALMYLNEGTLLNNCKVRYLKKQIYTYVANLLIAINPYEPLPDLYDNEAMKRYKGKSLGLLPPHLFALADKAYRDMKSSGQSQSIIVSGESGAGKTESQKLILNYLCHCYSDNIGQVEQRILETNPILDAFGNARTVRNNNSSRFGKFVEVYFNKKFVVAGGHISHYLLEKSRVCQQQPGERNYHVFYQLFASGLAEQLQLTNPDDFNYLRNGCTQFFATEESFSEISDEHKSKKSPEPLFDAVMNDRVDFERLSKALLTIGLNEEMRKDLFRSLGGILHLGNIEFGEETFDNKGGSKILAKSENSLMLAAKLLGLDPLILSQRLRSKILSRGGPKGTVIVVQLKIREATAARDAFAKAIYSRLFDQVVNFINQSVPSEDSTNYIGVLDIAGFESFAVNSFEQFCINFCNEKLQLFFSDRILKQEQDLYEKEELNVPKVVYCSNEDCIDLFEGKKIGIFDCLDEEARLPSSSSQHFTANVHQIHRNNKRLETPIKSAQRSYRSMRDNEGFIVHHYAGAVCYDTSTFLEKNNDALHDSLEMLLESSTNYFVIKCLSSKSVTPESKGRLSVGRLNVSSVGSKFRSQLAVLINKLTQTGTHFVHCVKPNSNMSPSQFRGAQILNQLKCAGMASVLKLMQKGYPSRTVFADLYKTYCNELPPQLAVLSPRLFCKSLFHAMGLNEVDYKFGLTKIFFRAGKMMEFDQLIKQDQENVKSLVEKARGWILRSRWRKLQYAVLACIKLDRKIKYNAEQAKIKARRLCWRRAQYCVWACVKMKKRIDSRAIELAETCILLEEEDNEEPSCKVPKYDLTAWTYDKIRKEINSPTEEGLAEASRGEFHRRLKAYQKWHALHKKSN